MGKTGFRYCFRWLCGPEGDWKVTVFLGEKSEYPLSSCSFFHRSLSGLCLHGHRIFVILILSVQDNSFKENYFSSAFKLMFNH